MSAFVDNEEGDSPDDEKVIVFLHQTPDRFFGLFLPILDFWFLFFILSNY